MQANRGRDTAPELAVRRAVHALGLRYRVSQRPVKAFPRTADMVFASPKVAVFMDGCYWHGCPEHFIPPRTNVEFWNKKIQRNVERDRETRWTLEQHGWLVLRYWEHDDPTEVAQQIRQMIVQRLEV
jgi:DNA mismatch endonuclease (patch repair protein)